MQQRITTEIRLKSINVLSNPLRISTTYLAVLALFWSVTNGATDGIAIIISRTRDGNMVQYTTITAWVL